MVCHAAHLLAVWPAYFFVPKSALFLTLDLGGDQTQLLYCMLNPQQAQVHMSRLPRAEAMASTLRGDAVGLHFPSDPEAQPNRSKRSLKG